MTKANKETAVAEELQRANQALTAFELLVRGGVLSDAVSRLYYCLLHRVKALLLTEGLEPKSHEGALHLLSQHFVKPGHLEPAATQFFAQLMKYREEADYSPSFTFAESDVTGLRDGVNSLSAKLLDLIRAAGFQA
ncbi:MAG: HEPN domain-containing protein [Spirochaetia bacterium]